MRGQISLQDAMMAVAQRVETLRLEQPEQLKRSPLTELEAFIQMDTLLAELNKEFQDVRRHHRELVHKNGPDDPMARVAADLEDSAWCAMQTRLLELRSQRILMRKAQRLIHQARREEEEREEKKRALKMAAFVNHVATIEDQRENKAIPGLLEWLIFYIWVQRENNLMREFMEPARHRRLAA